MITNKVAGKKEHEKLKSKCAYQIKTNDKYPKTETSKTPKTPENTSKVIRQDKYL